MAILAECDICGNQHRVKDGLVGNPIRCKECGVQFIVPDGHVISPETFIEAGGRLRRREPNRAASLWPRLVAGLVASLVVAALFGVIWTITTLVRPTPKDTSKDACTVNGPVSSCGGNGRSVSATPSIIQER